MQQGIPLKVIKKQFEIVSMALRKLQRSTVICFFWKNETTTKHCSRSLKGQLNKVLLMFISYHIAKGSFLLQKYIIEPVRIRNRKSSPFEAISFNTKLKFHCPSLIKTKNYPTLHFIFMRSACF